MLRLCLLLILAHDSRTFLTDPPSFIERLDSLYEKLERLTVAPALKPEQKLYEKLDRLNSLSPEISDDDEELLSAMQIWGKISPEQLVDVAKELQASKDEPYDGRSELVDDYNDDWNYEDLQDIQEDDYAMDARDEYETEEEDLTTKPGETVIRPVPLQKYIDPVAATNEKPKLVDISSLTAEERLAVRRSAFKNIRTVTQAGKCSSPQPRWLAVRHLAQTPDTVYLPPYVQLHRCTADAGCCSSEDEVCSPVEGRYVTISLFLHKIDNNLTLARMRFYNHTRCSCIAPDAPVTARVDHDTSERPVTSEAVRESLNDWRVPTEEPKLDKEVEIDKEPTAPPLLRRCTCPVFFQARVVDDVCSCRCEWPDQVRRRDCLSLARGREHFGLRDRVCVANGDCNPPVCDYGAYDKGTGKCPLRRYKSIRFSRRSRRYHRDKTVV